MTAAIDRGHALPYGCTGRAARLAGLPDAFDRQWLQSVQTEHIMEATNNATTHQIPPAAGCLLLPEPPAGPNPSSGQAAAVILPQWSSQPADEPLLCSLFPCCSVACAKRPCCHLIEQAQRGNLLTHRLTQLLQSMLWMKSSSLFHHHSPPQVLPCRMFADRSLSQVWPAVALHTSRMPQ